MTDARRGADFAGRRIADGAKVAPAGVTDLGQNTSVARWPERTQPYAVWHRSHVVGFFSTVTETLAAVEAIVKRTV